MMVVFECSVHLLSAVQQKRFQICLCCKPIGSIGTQLVPPQMATVIKNAAVATGKLFYHIISTEAAQHCSPEHKQQLEQGMRLTLTALADRLEVDLSHKTSQQVQHLKNKIRRYREKIRQQRQQASRQQLNVQTMPMQSSTAGVVAAAAATCMSSTGHAGRNNCSTWSDDVLWVLKNYCLFHTRWSSSKSPEYNGGLLNKVTAELFGKDFKLRGPGD